MDNSILTCKYINKILAADDTLMQMIPMKNFNALKFEADVVRYPYVIYGRSALTPRYTKEDMPAYSTVQITYNVVSDKYLEAIEIANALRHALEKKGYKNDDIFIDRINLLSVSESVGEEAYIQTLVFETDVC